MIFILHRLLLHFVAATSQRVRMLAGFMEVAEAIGSDVGIATAKQNISMAKS
jgi:hypothetical protein